MTPDTIGAVTGRPPRSNGCPPQYTAVVHACDGIRFVVTESTGSILLESLGAYVLANAEHQLWPSDMIAVVDSLRRGDIEAAIERYFLCVGSRWDTEWLVYAGSLCGDDVAHSEYS
jgi:hypothetical protein